jgi:2-polyprenyl-3-methyl-5-hydroxy-6-metoxy-1,4-benzoquinol methylase
MAELPTELEQRIQKEGRENNTIYSRRSAAAYDLSDIHYGHKAMLDWAFQRLPNLKGARVLDVGVGQGASSVLLALAGADVSGIEVSTEALKIAASLANRYGVKIDFRQMPGEKLLFDAATFDAILCMSAYHHMDLNRAATEFARVLRPDGRLIMNEPLATNPPAWLYRRLGKLFSREATSEESPLRVRDLFFLRNHFRKVEWHGMFLLSVGLFGLDRLWNNSNPMVHSLTQAAFKYVGPVDASLTKIPGLRRTAWRIAIVADR